MSANKASKASTTMGRVITQAHRRGPCRSQPGAPLLQDERQYMAQAKGGRAEVRATVPSMRRAWQDHTSERGGSHQQRYIRQHPTQPSGAVQIMPFEKDERREAGMNYTVLTAILLFVMFVGLKVTGQIDWSWWAVTAPLWIMAAARILASAALAYWLTRRGQTRTAIGKANDGARGKGRVRTSERR